MAISLSSDTKENTNSLQEPQYQASAVFTAAAKALKDSHKTSGGAPKTSKSCSRRWATLKANCLVVQKLRELSGFGWDEMRKIVIASDKVWDDYLEAHPEAKVWRSTPFPLYDDIIVLIDGCHATGDGALHINSVGSETSPPWPSTLVLDDEDDVFVGEDVCTYFAHSVCSEMQTCSFSITNFNWSP
ncbi:hypothetical protein CY34DRAFT_107000 [Suillus luteus UH-Slu-Lm8-n1]|uniref:Myb/SANT-like domain-containing protein n=1 Tax=Suillus luteus UH-Slu-Lm8-n1 TaxID=930992 RepID=A0A0C9ZWG7_9AGAM|nr:hypothetical protein CY34DRAFT_107000 [Suillus luteus UH-Slu-Lm8-n1]